jgi:hypothetical protein
MDLVCIFLGVGVLGLALSHFLSRPSARERRRQKHYQGLKALRDYKFPRLVREVFQREHSGMPKQAQDLAFAGLKEYFMLVVAATTEGRAP